MALIDSVPTVMSSLLLFGLLLLIFAILGIHLYKGAS